jgi:hypothetical protein
MGQGRDRWQQLGELGKEFARVEQELQELEQRQQARPRSSGQPASAPVGGPATGPDLERAWADFESRQELEDLRRRSRPSGP